MPRDIELENNAIRQLFCEAAEKNNKLDARIEIPPELIKERMALLKSYKYLATDQLFEEVLKANNNYISRSICINFEDIYDRALEMANANAAKRGIVEAKKGNQRITWVDEVSSRGQEIKRGL